MKLFKEICTKLYIDGVFSDYARPVEGYWVDCDESELDNYPETRVISSMDNKKLVRVVTLETKEQLMARLNEYAYNYTEYLARHHNEKFDV